MTMKHFRPVFVATSFLLAACPPPAGDTTAGSSESSSEGESSTGDTDSGVTQSTPADPTTMGETTATSTGVSDSESMSGPDTDPSSTSSSTGPTPACREDSDCGGGTPFCADETCVACDGTPDPNAACAGLGEDLNYCVGGECHECSVDDNQCAKSTPVCDASSLECVGCTLHAQCPDSACTLETGVCNDTAYVLYVDRLVLDCMAGDGSEATPYCKITDAIVRTMDEPGAGWTIKIRAGNYTEEPLMIPGEAQITLSGWDGTPRLRANDDSGPTLTINGGAKVQLDHLQFSNNDSAEGVRCTGGRVWADDVKLSTNKAAGYYSTDCTSIFNRTVFYDNDGGGIESYGVGTTTIISSYVTGNGTQNSGDYGGIRSAQENELHLVYSTVVNNLSKSGPRSLHCDRRRVPGGGPQLGAHRVRGAVGRLPGRHLHHVGARRGVDGEGVLVATMADIENFFEPMTRRDLQGQARHGDAGRRRCGRTATRGPTTTGRTRPKTDGDARLAGRRHPDARRGCDPAAARAAALAEAPPCGISGAGMEQTGHMLDQRYRLGSPLGEGGMATVYLAEDTRLRKAVAIKVLHAEFAGQPKVVQRLVQEARAISAVDHPNVVDVTDVGETQDGGVFLVMELLQGEDLKALLKREGPLPWSRLGPMVMQICAALAAAHARGIIHRDVKPSNCFRVRGGGNRDFIKVLDFGVAKVFAGDDGDGGPRSTSGVLLGTPEYMAPELPRGLAADARADVYAVGVLMYKLLTGTPPFVDEGYVAILTQHMFEPVEPPRRRAPDRDIPGSVEAVILRALAKDREGRFQSMRELAEAVAATLPGGPSVGSLAVRRAAAVDRARGGRGRGSAQANRWQSRRRRGRRSRSRASACRSRTPGGSSGRAAGRSARCCWRRRRRSWRGWRSARSRRGRRSTWWPRRRRSTAIAAELRACGEPVPLMVAVDRDGAVTRVEPAREAVDPSVLLACLRERLGRETFASRAAAAVPFRATYD
jgi:tRNA A-37 threonylcarbamoyl transferase component Bud32